MNIQHLSQFELRQLCYFVALVRSENNFTKAAQQLGIQQPPLTRRIQALEAWLNMGKGSGEVKLLDRSTRPITLTTAGEVFLEEAQQALFHLDRAIVRSQQASQGQIGHLAVGITNFIANTIFPDIVQQFQQRFPNVILETHEITVEQRFNMLRQRQVDVIFEQSEQFDHIDQEFIFQPIFQEYFILAVPAQHRLAVQAQISLNDLQLEKIILPPLDIFPFYQQVITQCRETGFEPTLVENVTATGVLALLSLVTANVGVSILPNHVLEVQRKGVVYRSLTDLHLTRQVAVVCRQTDNSIVLSKFLRVIEDVAQLSRDSW
jgi:DNA-binding transcriptional LysR family regulator